MEKRVKNIVVKNIMLVVLFVRSVFLMPHGACKYSPSCTLYAEEALIKLPLHKAVFAIIKRLLRCNPLSNGGYDPVYCHKEGKIGE